MFDGQIRNAPSRIDPIGSRERIGGTDVETSPANAATIALSLEGSQLNCREDRTEVR